MIGLEMPYIFHPLLVSAPDAWGDNKYRDISTNTNYSGWDSRQIKVNFALARVTEAKFGRCLSSPLIGTYHRMGIGNWQIFD